MPILATIQDVLAELIGPWTFMAISFSHIPATIRGLIRDKNYRALFSFDGFREALFGTFWATVGPNVKLNGEQRVIPLLEGLYGTVIEVGAGSGMWADVLARFRENTSDADNAAGLRNRKTTGGHITKIYGVEPNPISAKALEKRVKDLGMDDIYQVVPVGIESVDDPSAWNGKIEPGSVDCIVGVLCLCSIPEPEKNIKLLYKLLKPGGHWYVYEHVKVWRGGPLISLYQRFTNLIWPHFLGGCQLCRDTEKNLRAAGPFQEVDLAQPAERSSSYQILPHKIGTLTK
ncbi:methyltransferase domain-containing protein [Trichoderma breve]|uniref:Methyltransferase domain-containing protein n=1 Tax=Trichoderma breve TaxID=2034170 RepID=A0A9W9EAH7_9HYPO|nr:methyltransferase domain-containing protein [Trichoderma breve]KAJ4863120.1 methyltransferase domain-containing protein [Trichoderma breve]